MPPIVQPQLVNDVFGDPGLYAELMFERRALLFDLGEIGSLAARKLLKISDVFVSHAHADHFSGFDRLLRLYLGRNKTLSLSGPPDFIDRVGHKLAGYSWNLIRNYSTVLTFEVAELHPGGHIRRARFSSATAFCREDVEAASSVRGLLLDDGRLRVRAAVLDHQIPCLAFALEERAHVNIWKPRLAALGLAVGPWLRDLKNAVLDDAPETTPVRAWWREAAATVERYLPLGELKREVLTVAPGQKIVYVVDVAYHDENAGRIVELARGADILFIEAPFLDADAAIAARKNHLTARQAGELARLAGVKRVVPFHFSPRYQGCEERLRDEVQAAFLLAS